MKLKAATFTLPPHIISKLDEVSRAVGITKSELMRRILNEAVDDLGHYVGMPSTVKRGPLNLEGILTVERIKAPIRGYTIPGPEDVDRFRMILDHIPLYTPYIHEDAYYTPHEYTMAAVAEKTGYSKEMIWYWLYDVKGYKVGWFHKGWILKGNTMDHRTYAVFKSDTTDGIIESWLNGDPFDIRPMRTRAEFKWHILKYLERNGPSTMNKIYEGTVMRDPYRNAGESRYSQRRSFTILLRQMEGVDVKEKGRPYVYGLKDDVGGEIDDKS